MDQGLSFVWPLSLDQSNMVESTRDLAPTSISRHASSTTTASCQAQDGALFHNCMIITLRHYTQDLCRAMPLICNVSSQIRISPLRNYLSDYRSGNICFFMLRESNFIQCMYSNTIKLFTPCIFLKLVS